MQNNKNKKRRFAGKGYYIALIACIAAVGLSGYVFTTTVRHSAVETSAPVTISPKVSAAPAETAPPAPSAEVSSAPAKDTAAEEGDSYEETMGSAPKNPIWPLNGDVVATFSQDTLTYSETMKDWRTHEGLDIAATAGDAVAAVNNGTVTAVYEDDYLGSVVVISHDNDVSTLYANLTDVSAVTVGESVAAGQTIGQVGNTALLEIAEPDHLHFEVFSEGQAVDPLDYLSGT